MATSIDPNDRRDLIASQAQIKLAGDDAANHRAHHQRRQQIAGLRRRYAQHSLHEQRQINDDAEHSHAEHEHADRTQADDRIAKQRVSGISGSMALVSARKNTASITTENASSDSTRGELQP